MFDAGILQLTIVGFIFRSCVLNLFLESCFVSHAGIEPSQLTARN